jgi:hypothetical protein
MQLLQVQTTQEKIARAETNASAFVKRHQREIETIATVIVAVALLLWAAAKVLATGTAKVAATFYDYIRHHAIVAETVASGKNCRIALCPPKHLREGEYKKYHAALMASRPNWIIAAESFRQKAVQRVVGLGDRIKSEVAAIVSITSLGL